MKRGETQLTAATTETGKAYAASASRPIVVVAAWAVAPAVEDQVGTETIFF